MNKSKTSSDLQSFWQFVCVVQVVLVTASIALSQSGRIDSKPSPSPTPSPVTSPQERPQPNDEIYKIVHGITDDRKSFFEELNKAGKQGYRMKSMVYGRQRSGDESWFSPVAIMKFDEGKYEYDSFQTSSSWWFSIGNFDEEYTKKSAQGYQVIDFFTVGLDCPEDSSESFIPSFCKVDYLFILERELPPQFRKPSVLNSHVGRINKADTKARNVFVNEQLAQGFYPTIAFSKYQVLLEQPTKRDEGLRDDLEVNVVSSGFKKTISELAQQGYRLTFSEGEVAIMYRNADTRTPANYTWLNVGDKKLAQKLEILQQSGAAYRLRYRSGYLKYHLVFEQTEDGLNSKREYKLLNFQLQVTTSPATLRRKAPLQVNIALPESSRATLSEINALAKQGFVVRDLFVTDSEWKQVSVLLERPNPGN